MVNKQFPLDVKYVWNTYFRSVFNVYHFALYGKEAFLMGCTPKLGTLGSIRGIKLCTSIKLMVLCGLRSFRAQIWGKIPQDSRACSSSFLLDQFYLELGRVTCPIQDQLYAFDISQDLSQDYLSLKLGLSIPESNDWERTFTNMFTVWIYLICLENELIHFDTQSE